MQDSARVQERQAALNPSPLTALVLILLCFWLGGSTAASAQQKEPSENLISTEVNFSARLLELGRPDSEGRERNLVTSPAGIFQSLAVLALASSGDTRDELLKALGLKEEQFSLESASVVDWFSGHTPSRRFEFETDLELEENNGYGLRVAKEPAERSYGQITGLHQGDLIFRVDGMVMRRIEDFKNVCRTSSGKVVLEGYEYELGETFSNRSLGLRKFLVASGTAESPFQTINLGVFHEELNPSDEFLRAADRILGFRATKLSPLDARGFGSPEFKTWFQQVSGGKFGDFSHDFLDLLDARFLLVNLARFESPWGMAAKPIGDRAFRGFDGERQAAFCELEGVDFKLLEFDLLSWISVPLGSGHEFRIVFPRSEGEQVFAEIRQRLGEPAVQASLDASRADQVALRLALPCFAFSSGLQRAELQQICKLENAFSNRAELPGFSPTVMLGDLAQKAKVVVDSRGVFAAAATGAVGVPKSLPQDFKSVTIDRPFFFQICRSDGLVLFQGQVVDPLAVPERFNKE